MGRATVRALLLACLAATPAPAGEKAEPMKPGDVLLTIYTPHKEEDDEDDWWRRPSYHELDLEAAARHHGLGVVKQCRALDLPKGVSDHQFTGVAALLEPTSTRFVCLTDPLGTRLLEQNFHFDLVSEGAMLKRFLDREIEFVDTEQHVHRGILLSQGPPLILRAKDGSIEMINYLPAKYYDYEEVQAKTRVFRFPSLPPDLVTRPTLSWSIKARAAGRQNCILAYQTGGMAWRSDYSALIDPDDAHLDLAGWVTIANVSGARYPNARLKLFAGNVRRLLPPRSALGTEGGYFRGDSFGEDFFGDEDEDEGFEEKGFFEYHLYTLGRRTTVENNQTKQIQFIDIPKVPVKKVYTYSGLKSVWDRGDYDTDETYGADCRKTVRVNLEFTNDEDSKLGIPLPKGIVRVYKRDQGDGRSEFVGEDKIDHTPRDETIRLYVGDAFDIVGERIQTSYERPKDRELRESFAIEIRNHKDAAVTVRVVERLYRGPNWKIEKIDLPFEKLDSNTIQFRVSVPARKNAKVTYTAFYWYPPGSWYDFDHYDNF